MIALWMLYALGFGAVLGGAMLALERVVRLRRFPTRGLWLVAFAASWMVPVTLALVPRAPAPPTRPGAETRVRGTADAPSGAPAPAQAAVTTPGSPSLEALTVPLLVLWGAGTLLLLGWLGRRGAMQFAARRRWVRREVDGRPVLVAPEAGPAVVGMRRLEIVLPEWAVRGDEMALRLMLRHEEQHVRARDPNFLLLAAVAVVLMPWNALLWWQLRRLRLAIEVDCDARVLGLGENAHRYGSLLLDVASRYAGPDLLPGAAFSESASQLSRRIDAMSAPRPRRPILHAIGFGALGAAAIIIACAAPRPEPIRPAASAERIFSPLAIRRPRGTWGYAHPYTREQMTAALRRYFPEVLRGDTGTMPLRFVLDTDGRVVSTSRGRSAAPPFPYERLENTQIEDVGPGYYGPAPVRVEVLWLKPDSLLGEPRPMAGAVFTSIQSTGPYPDTLTPRLEGQVRNALSLNTGLMRGLTPEDTAFVWFVLSASGDAVRAGRAPNSTEMRQGAHLASPGAYFTKWYPQGELAPWAVVVAAAWMKP